MTIIQKIIILIKKNTNFLNILDAKTIKIQKFNPIFILLILIVFSILFFTSSNLIIKKKEKHTNNLIEVTKTNDFLNLTSFKQLLYALGGPGGKNSCEQARFRNLSTP